METVIISVIGFVQIEPIYFGCTEYQSSKLVSKVQRNPRRLHYP